ncbi:MAG: HD domain-containing protein [Candidatus Acidiferrales bacterium]
MSSERPIGERFRRALAYAAQVHAGQYRKGTSRPYVSHLLGVTSIVLVHGGDEDEAIAALLHDAVEDQGGKRRLRDIRAKFGKRVARIVEGCTDSDLTPKPPWLERKKEYLKHLRDADSSIRLVSAADKLYNASETLADFRSHRESIWKRFKGGRQGTLWYYREVAKVLRKKGPKELSRDLDRTVKELARASRAR